MDDCDLRYLACLVCLLDAFQNASLPVRLVSKLRKAFGR